MSALVTFSVRCCCGEPHSYVLDLDNHPGSDLRHGRFSYVCDRCGRERNRVMSYQAHNPPRALLAPLVRLWDVLTLRRFRKFWLEYGKYY